MSFAELIGFAAAILTTVAFLPQAVKAWQTKSTKDISLKMYMLSCVGVALWLVYGWMISSTPVMAANAVTLVLVSSILVSKLKYG